MKVLKTLLKIFILLTAAVYLVIAITKINTLDERDECRGLDIQILDDQQTGFVNENEVRELLVAKKLFPEGKALKDVNLAQLESVLVVSPYIDKTLCYKTAEQTVMIKVTPRIPVLHVLNAAGEDFYIDNKGGIMPRGHHTIDLPVMTGNVQRATAGSLYASFGNLLAKDAYWRNFIEEIYVTGKGELELTPQAGQHTILLGDTSNLTDKLHRMKVFYAEGLPKTGWNRYSTISLKYDNQVICTKAN